MWWLDVSILIVDVTFHEVVICNIHTHTHTKMGRPRDTVVEVFEHAFHLFGRDVVTNALRYRYRRLRAEIERDVVTTILTMLEDGNVRMIEHPDTIEYVTELSLCVSHWIERGGIDVTDENLPQFINSESNPCRADDEYYDILYDAYLRFGHTDVIDALSAHYANVESYNDAYLQRVIAQMRNPVFVPEVSGPVEQMMGVLRTWLERNEMMPNPFR